MNPDQDDLDMDEVSFKTGKPVATRSRLYNRGNNPMLKLNTLGLSTSVSQHADTDNPSLLFNQDTLLAAATQQNEQNQAAVSMLEHAHNEEVRFQQGSPVKGTPKRKAQKTIKASVHKSRSVVTKQQATQKAHNTNEPRKFKRRQ